MKQHYHSNCVVVFAEHSSLCLQNTVHCVRRTQFILSPNCGSSICNIRQMAEPVYAFSVRRAHPPPHSVGRSVTQIRLQPSHALSEASTVALWDPLIYSTLNLLGGVLLRQHSLLARSLSLSLPQFAKQTLSLCSACVSSIMLRCNSRLFPHM